LPTALRGRDWEVLPAGGEKLLALTFDAGGSEAGVTSILATLRSTGTPGTFFLTGSFVDQYPESARRIAAAHRVGNHSATHPHLTTLDDAAVRGQISRGADRIRAVTGVDPRPWFRFPYGDRDARTIAEVNQLGYAAVRWTVDSLGWQGTKVGHQSVDSVTARVLGAARPGGVVMMHVGANPDDGTTLDAAALAGVIDGPAPARLPAGRPRRAAALSLASHGWRGGVRQFRV
jgi:peptidoglycan/xylan/chitin deacetylase (PgdA/CDA1 family)